MSEHTMCNNADIKELLPSYLDGALELPEQTRIAGHLQSCADCREELAVLGMFAAEAVPDPGETFWASLPDRVHRAVQAEQSGKKAFGLSRLRDWLFPPRVSWAAASVVALLVVAALSWFIISPAEREQAMLAQDDEYADEILAAEAMPLAVVSSDDLDHVDAWAGRELASIATEAIPVITIYGQDLNLYEEIAELNAREAERLSVMLSQLTEEG